MSTANKKQMMAVALVVAITVVLSVLILKKDKGQGDQHADHDEHAEKVAPGAFKRGPHRGSCADENLSPSKITRPYFLAL